MIETIVIGGFGIVILLQQLQINFHRNALRKLVSVNQETMDLLLTFDEDIRELKRDTRGLSGLRYIVEDLSKGMEELEAFKRGRVIDPEFVRIFKKLINIDTEITNSLNSQER